MSDRNTRLTYAQLYDEANSIARELLAQGVEPSEPVALQLPPSGDQVLCQTAVVLAYGICFPVGQEMPQLRVRSLLERARVRFFISFDGLEGFEQISSQLIQSVHKGEPVNSIEEVSLQRRTKLILERLTSYIRRGLRASRKLSKFLETPFCT